MFSYNNIHIGSGCQRSRYTASEVMTATVIRGYSILYTPRSNTLIQRLISSTIYLDRRESRCN